MPSLTNLTAEQLRNSTKAQIVAAVDVSFASMTKRDLIVMELGTDRIADAPIAIYRKVDRQIESQIEVVRDVETGVQLSRKVISWTYYEKEKDAPVDTIAIVEYDDRDREISRKTIKHFTDGSKPKVI